MSDAIKWGLLVAGIVAVIALVVAIGFGEYISVSTILKGCEMIVGYASVPLKNVRSLLNNFFFPETYPALTFAIWWLFLKPIVTIGVKLTVSIYHYIFK